MRGTAGSSARYSRMSTIISIQAPGASLVRQMMTACQIMAGVSLIGLGAALTVTPIPLGLPLMAGGFVLLTSCSHTCRKGAAGLRRRLSLLDAALIRIEDKAPGALARMLRQSNPRYAYAISVPITGVPQ
tara:strand:+ start:9437 stop:9826 length:390 start_codon:yes stop_codon:yes gene_type:complete